jgi:hypothetical protein
MEGSDVSSTGLAYTIVDTRDDIAMNTANEIRLRWRLGRAFPRCKAQPVADVPDMTGRLRLVHSPVAVGALDRGSKVDLQEPGRIIVEDGWRRRDSFSKGWLEAP